MQKLRTGMQLITRSHRQGQLLVQQGHQLVPAGEGPAAGGLGGVERRNVVPLRGASVTGLVVGTLAVGLVVEARGDGLHHARFSEGRHGVRRGSRNRPMTS